MQVTHLQKKHRKTLFRQRKEANVPYIRYERESQRFQNEKLIMVRDYAEAAKLALLQSGELLC